MKLYTCLNHILSESSFDNFTVLELRNALLSFPGNDNKCKRQTRIVTYRRIRKLESKGLLIKVDAENNREIRYRKSPEFSPTKPALVKPSRLENTSQSPSGHNNSVVRRELTEKLQRYKFELLTCLGESDEYKTLYSEFPELKNQLEESYNQAKDNSSKLLGRIKAIESVINQQAHL